MHKVDPSLPRTCQKIRVLIVEDSPTVQMALKHLLEIDDAFVVIGTASNGHQALDLTQKLQPDIITMDVLMPEMDGIMATRRIMAETPTPIVVISNSISDEEVDTTHRALSAGALCALQKPRAILESNTLGVGDNICTTLKVMSQVKVIRQLNRRKRLITKDLSSVPYKKAPAIKVIALCSSTGGHKILKEILSPLPQDFPIPIIVLQHITPGFGRGLATWLGSNCALRVKVAATDDSLFKRGILVAPDDQHIKVTPSGTINLITTDPVNGHRPSGDVLFTSLAQHMGSQAMGIILTGMGSDGALGLQEMHGTGAITIAQDEASSVIFGMPRAAIQLGAAQFVLSDLDILAKLMEYAH